MIGKLTPKQIERLTYYRDKWLAIGLSTQKADRKMAETGITKAYKIVGLKRPKIVWTLSPLSSGLTRYCVFEILKNKSASVRDSVWASVGASVRDSVRDSVGDSMWDSVGDSMWASVRASMWDSVRDSVWAYTGSFFRLSKWKYIKHAPGKYPYACLVSLWEKGLVPSFDGTTWRLHAGPTAKVVFTISVEDLRKP